MHLPPSIASLAIPSPLRRRPNDDRRARLIVASALVVAAITTLLALARLLADGPRAPVAYVLFCVVVGMLAVPVVLRATSSLDVAGAMIPLVGTAGTTTMALLDGGFGSEALLWFVFIPLVAVLFVGATGATWFGGLGLVCLVALLCAQPIDRARLLDFVGAAGALGFSASLGLLYEASRRRAARHKDEFVTNVSHELRTPLTSVQGSLALLETGMAGALEDDAKQLVALARRNASRLGSLVDDLLTIRNLEIDDEPWVLAPTSLRDVISSALDAELAETRASSIHVVIDGQVPDLFIVTHSARLRQVLRSLVSNAIKHSPQGGEVHLRACVLDGEARIAVEDRGQGIPQSFHSRLFDKFTQADASETRTVGGAGLGLAIAHRIVNRLGGRLFFETAVGKGTTFFVAIPTQK